MHRVIEDAIRAARAEAEAVPEEERLWDLARDMLVHRRAIGLVLEGASPALVARFARYACRAAAHPMPHGPVTAEAIETVYHEACDEPDQSDNLRARWIKYDAMLLIVAPPVRRPECVQRLFMGEPLRGQEVRLLLWLSDQGEIAKMRAESLDSH